MLSTKGKKNPIISDVPAKKTPPKQREAFHRYYARTKTDPGMRERFRQYAVTRRKKVKNDPIEIEKQRQRARERQAKDFMKLREHRKRWRDKQQKLKKAKDGDV